MKQKSYKMWFITCLCSNKWKQMQQLSVDKQYHYNNVVILLECGLQKFY